MRYFFDEMSQIESQPGRQAFALPVALFVGCFFILTQTLVPTIFVLDSAELVVAARTLGIAHTPSYPLYLTLLHGFLRIPVGDIAFRGNLFSAFCLGLTAPVLYLALREVTDSLAVSLATALLFTWSYYVWSIGLFAEVYASQLLTLAGAGYALIRLGKHQDAEWRKPWATSALFGIAIGMHPTSILFAPGFFLAFLLFGISWRRSVAAIALSIFIGLLPFIYLPIRYAANPVVNHVGLYDAQGVFVPVNLQTVQGLIWMLSGRQFEKLYFAEGYLPSFQQARDVLLLFAGNFLGFGLPLGVFGAYLLYSRHPRQFYIWLLLFLPYTYFYTTYGALDKQTMLGPSFLLWTIPLALGLEALSRPLPGRLRAPSLLALPLILLVINFPLLDLSGETSVRAETEALMESVPENAVVFADAGSFAPLEYLQVIENERTDLRLYHLYLFPSPELEIFTDRLLGSGQVIWVVGQEIEDRFSDYTLIPVETPGLDEETSAWKVYVLAEPEGQPEVSPSSRR